MASTVQLRNQVVVPILVEHILACKHTQFKIAGLTFQIVCVMGVISDINPGLYEIKFKLEDHSGKIQALIRCETQSEMAKKLADLHVNKYIKFIGTVQNHNGEKVFFVIKINPIHDLDALNSHLLQSACARLEMEAELVKKLANCMGIALADALNENEECSDTSIPLSELQNMVYDIVRCENSDDGIEKKNIFRLFASYQAPEVNQALDYLISEGHIYQTIDEDHLKVAIN